MGIGADCDKIAQFIHESGAGIQYVLKRYRRSIPLGASEAIGDMEAEGGTIYKKSKVITAYLTPGVAAAQDDTNYVVLTLGYGDQAAGALTTLATYSTKTTGGTGALAAGTRITLTLPTDGTETIAAGKRLAVTVDQNGSGKTLAGAVIELELEYASDA